jgi:hypothetical protein
LTAVPSKSNHKQADLTKDLGLSPDQLAALQRAENKMAPRLLIMVRGAGGT